MIRSRRNQRGVVRVASGMLLAAVCGLLSLAGCSAGEVGASDAESLGTVREALLCGTTTCVQDTCVVATCSTVIKNTCTYTADAKQLDACKTPAGEGVCIARPRDPIPLRCCTGCIVQTGLNTYSCIDAPDATSCGTAGQKCVDCDKTSDTCKTHVCKGGTCVDDQPIADDQPCTDQSGRCWQGSCCGGCIDANKKCQPGTALGLCGKSPASTGLVKCANCNDSEPCTTDACGADGKCSNNAVADTTPCLDANKCDGAESCQAGKCTDQVGFMCPKDNNPCHAPACDPSAGCSQQNLSNVSCADNDKCNGSEMCSNGVCQPGTSLNCNDNDPCTADSCDAALGCVHVPLEPGSSCDNNANVCDGSGTCDAGGNCVAIPALKCDDGNPCTDDKCDPVKGCGVTFNTADCSDNDPCTLVDKCSNGSCAGTGQLNCNDGKACTADSCIKGVGCQNDPVRDDTPCNDGNECTQGDRCVAGVCTPLSGKTCPATGNSCTIARCNPLQGSNCTVENDDGARCQVDKCHQFTQCAGGVCPPGALIDCDDGNPCTIDDCVPATGCTHDNDPQAKCSDGSVCTTDDACVDGKCTGTPRECTAIDDCHVAGTCNEQTGQCDDPRADDETPCENDTGTCQSGLCAPNPGVGGQGAGGEATGGSTSQGGAPDSTTAGGEGNEGTVGGGVAEAGAGVTPSAGAGGKGSSGSSSSSEAGSPEQPEHVFVREPGGCSCRVPASSRSPSRAWLGAVGLGLALAARRRRRRAGRAA